MDSEKDLHTVSPGLEGCIPEGMGAAIEEYGVRS